MTKHSLKQRSFKKTNIILKYILIRKTILNKLKTKTLLTNIYNLYIFLLWSLLKKISIVSNKSYCLLSTRYRAYYNYFGCTRHIIKYITTSLRIPGLYLYY